MYKFIKKNGIHIASGGITMGIVGMALVGAAMMAPPELVSQDHECLSMNIYHESRGERAEGQIAVAFTTINRVKHTQWPSTICEVVYQPKQFSWTHLIKNQSPKETKAWKRAQVIARDVLIGNVVDPTKGAVFYHANWIKNPYWAKKMTLSKVIGNHLFYTWDGVWDDDDKRDTD